MELRTILLAEDNPKDAELTTMALKENNLINEVVRVQDGVEAMDYLNSTGKYVTRGKDLPAVVLLDLHMPKMDGLEVLAAIRESGKLNQLPVVMLTTSNLEEDLVKSYRLGVNAFVVKPVELNDFVNVISQLGLFWGVINRMPTGNQR